MSWDRVIQDSDEEEPLIEDDFPASTDPLQELESPTDHRDGSNLEYDEPISHADQPADGIPDTLSVNFDQFLQSQDGAPVLSTSSQHQREKRWIPSAGEGQVGSIGTSCVHDAFYLSIDTSEISMIYPELLLTYYLQVQRLPKLESHSNGCSTTIPPT